MSTPHEKLAQSLEALHAVAKGGVVRASALSRTHRERLVQNGFLQEVMKGWLVVADPALSDGSSAAWYASYWSFVARYLAERFGANFCLSAEASLLRHVESSTVPQQVTIVTATESNQIVQLPFSTSLLIYRSTAGLPEPRIEREGLWLIDLPTALCKIPPTFFRIHPEEAEIALRMVDGPAAVLPYLLSEAAPPI